MNHSPLQIIFAGTPEFAATTLSALLAAQQTIIAVYTQPDRPAGRGLALSESPVKKIAQENQLPLFQPQSLKDPLEQEQLVALKADLMIVVAYGLVLPTAVLQAPRLGCINIHASLLPRWRGASPIQQAILAGDPKTGISLMQMDAGLDTGPLLTTAECPIYADDTSESLHERLAQLGAQTLLATLPALAQGKLHPQPQNAREATNATKINKEAGRINWQASVAEIDRQVRAFYPWPIAFSSYQGETLRIFAVQPRVAETPQASPGSIIAVSPQGLDIAAKDGLVRLLRIQAPGGRVLAIADFLNARQGKFVVGERFI